jgi:HEAT repeat protein
MNADEQQIVMNLFLRRISEEEFLRAFRIRRSDGTQFALSVLEQAYRERDAVSVECGLGLGFRFGMSPQYFDVLVKLSEAEWHIRHEDVVTALDELRDKRSVDALYDAALKLHPYLSFDDCRALAVKAIWGLGNLGDKSADEKLRILAKSDNSILREEAEKQLRRRQAGTSSV